jgi:pyrroline-5-carboxylate reductase
MNRPYALGVLGTGHIAAVIIRRLIENGYYTADRVIASNSRAVQAHPLPVTIADDTRDVVAQAGRLLLAVTPQCFRELAEHIRDHVTDDHLLISLMAGMATESIDAAFPHIRARVIRVMPNLPFELGYGVTGLYRGRHATQDDLESVSHLFAAGGVTVELEDEALMDVVTAVAGSGPAYFYYFVETIMAGGITAGLSPEDAQVLAAYACMGAGAMLLDRDASPRELREAVTSPGGTTEAAMKVLTAGRVAETVTEAVLAAYRRGQELGKLFNAPPTK